LDIDDPKEELHILKYVGKFVGCETECSYYPLGIHSSYELLNGSSSLNNWCKKAKFLGYKGIATCELNTMAASLDLQREATAAGLKYCFGYSLIVEVGNEKIGIKLYSQTQEGFQNMLRIQYHINVLRMEDKMIALYDLLHLAKGNVIVFGKLSLSWLVKPENEEVVKDMISYFEAAYAQIDWSEYKANRIDSQVLVNMKDYFDATSNGWIYGIEPVLIQDVYYPDADEYRNKIVLNKIDLGAAHEQSVRQYMKTLDELFDEFDALFSNKYSEDVFYLMCENTTKIIEPANAGYDMSGNYMPRYEMTPEEEAKYGTNHNMFRQLLEEGFKRFVPEGEEEVYRKRLEYETYILESTDNIDYFLIQYDCVNWAREHDILVGIGRGSAGGALCLYLMGITQIDPIKYSLIFERFLLPERAGLEAKELTKICKPIESSDYIELTLENGKTYKFDRDAEFLVNRNGKEIKIYADELEEDDDIIFDNKDLLFTL
jgi:DNA polymerase-3 subunit alpha